MKDKIINVLLGSGAIIIVLCVLGGNYLFPNNVPGLKKDEPYVFEDVWMPPIKEVEFCTRPLSMRPPIPMRCKVVHEDFSTRMYTFDLWPAGSIKEGSVLGYSFKVGQRTVELWRIRKGRYEEKYNGACLTKDPKCFWPSKNKCTKWEVVDWGSGKSARLCKEYNPKHPAQISLE